jgi:hypothetical protein
MANSIGEVGPKIINDGLILHLDAGNYESYPGSGATWYDLSKYQNNATINLGTYYNSVGTPFIKINDPFISPYSGVSFYAQDLSSINTVEVWAKLPPLNSYQVMFAFGFFGVLTVGNIGAIDGLGIWNGSPYWGVPLAQLQSLQIFNSWSQYIFVMRNDTTFNNGKIYINSENQSATNFGANIGDFNNGNGTIGLNTLGTNYPFSYDCAVFKIYNRELSQAEITQNYNALKTRFQ